jgi:hypothetical protein
MTAWRRRRATARIAKTLLFAWSFAIVAAWAHGCLLQPRSAHGAQQLAHRTLAPTTAAEAHSEGHDDAGRAACLDLCDDEQSVVPKAPTPGVALAAAPMIASVPWSFAPAASAFPLARPLAAAPPPQRPVAIRFSRLTI